MTRLLLFLAIAATSAAQNADPDAGAPPQSPAQNRKPAQLPPPGVAIPEKDRAELTAGAAELAKDIAALKLAKLAPGMDALIPDVEVFHKAVDWALRYDEFYSVKQVATAFELLKEGKSRAAALRDGKAPWTTQTGPVVRGYRSKIDGSVQPFGVVVPATWKGADDKKPRATWLWNHGRNEKLSELAFIAERMKSAGTFTPEDTFVVHPYGRYCNATKFAGEVDVFEALDAARRAYPVDNDRLVNAGFSMGGASAWHLGAHHSGLWAASHAGAGFAETAEYAGVFAAGKTPPPWWEVILYRWYDATVCAANFANSPMFAYHGSEDKQAQSTAIMKRYAEKEGVKIEEFIGPGVGHKYEAGVKKEIEARIAEVVKKGREEFPKKIRFVTHSPNDAKCAWITVMQLERSWERAEVEGTIEKNGVVTLRTKNVRSLAIKPPADAIKKGYRMQQVVINGHKWPPTLPSEPEDVISARINVRAATETVLGTAIESGYYMPPPPNAPANWIEHLQDEDGSPWEYGEGLHKASGICGPIDHAFMDSFAFVRPTGAPINAALGEWTKQELAHATRQWRGIFRGDAPTVDDTFLADAPAPDSDHRFDDDFRTKMSPAQKMMWDSNLILWGDPSSNAVLKRIADKLPVKWSKDGLEFGPPASLHADSESGTKGSEALRAGGVQYDAATHMPILIFPNPLNPRRYVVLNSGFTFSRAASSGTNSQQTPKLPDWAIVDTTVPPDDKFPGKIVDAGFFDEQWRFTKERPK